jgi:hypothetical protein
MHQAQKKNKEFEVENNDTSIYNTPAYDEEDSAHDANNDVPSQGCVSCWLQPVQKTKVVAKDLVNSVRGGEFACVYNRDSSEFMNKSKFERLILQHTNNDVPVSWDLLDKTRSCVVAQVVEDEDQGPSKEWGPHGWNCNSSKEQIELESNGKTEFEIVEI